MILEILNDKVMLVELSSDEMKEYKITYETLNSDNKASQSAIKNLLQHIDDKRLIKGEKVVVEALPTEEGGCFLIFTFVPPEKRKYKIRRAEKHSFFLVESLDNLLDFINVAKKNPEQKALCSIYKMDDNFFVSLQDSSPKTRILLSEFGRIAEKFVCDRVAEYGVQLGEVYLQ